LTRRLKPVIKPVPEPVTSPAAAAASAPPGGLAALCRRLGLPSESLLVLSLIGSLAAAWFLAQSGASPQYLLAAPALFYLRLLLETMYATAGSAAGHGGSRAAAFEELAARLSDTVILLGVTHSGLNWQASGYRALIAVLLAGHVGVLRALAGLPRPRPGLLSRSWMLLAIHAGAWATLGMRLTERGNARFAGWTIMDWSCVAIMAGCALSALVQFGRLLRALRGR
jgi:hypothetical protein